ncbi:MAG: hypothetical protein ACOX33_07485 [Dethiobacteria bacterium]
MYLGSFKALKAVTRIGMALGRAAGHNRGNGHVADGDILARGPDFVAKDQIFIKGAVGSTFLSYRDRVGGIMGRPSLMCSRLKYSFISSM